MNITNVLRDHGIGIGIRPSGTATPSDVLSGRTFINAEGHQTGTMPLRSGHVNAQSISRSGTTLRLRPPQGYVPGDTGNSIQRNDPNFLASNIRQGTSIFGLVGSLVEGKKVAEGTLARQGVSTGVQFVQSSGSQIATFYVEETGLDFQPSFVIVRQSLGISRVIQTILYPTVIFDTARIYRMDNGGTSGNTEGYFRLEGAAVVTNGFRLPVYSFTTSYSYLAVE